MGIYIYIFLQIFVALIKNYKTMNINFLELLLAALSSLVVGFIWYNPKVFGSIWMKETGITPEDGKGLNRVAIFAMSNFYAFLISFLLLNVSHSPIRCITWLYDRFIFRFTCYWNESTL